MKIKWILQTLCAILVVGCVILAAVNIDTDEEPPRRSPWYGFAGLAVLGGIGIFFIDAWFKEE